MTKFYYNVENIDTSLTHVTQLITVGTRTLTFDFQWAIASAEQCDLILRYLVQRAQSDPLLENGNYNREYEWFDYYIDLVGVNLDEWLATDPVLPISVLNATSVMQQKMILRQNIATAQTIEPALILYSETMRWQFTCTDQEGQITTGFVEPGGWFRNQSSDYSFRIHSARSYIGQENLNDIALEFEVYDA